MLTLAHTIRRKQICKGERFFAPTTQVPAGHIKKRTLPSPPTFFSFLDERKGDKRKSRRQGRPPTLSGASNDQINTNP